MKKKTLLIAVIILLIIAAIFIGWFRGRSGRTSEENADISQQITAKTPGEQVLDTRYPTDSKLGKMIDNRVSSVIGEETPEKITVKVTAPLIQEDLLSWYEAVSEEDYSDEALESEIEQLLMEKTPVEREYVLRLRKVLLFLPRNTLIT